MTSSYTLTETAAFTITHARQIASKIATDLKRMQRFYGYPSDEHIQAYEEEATLLIKNGYLKKVSYGFQRDREWIEPSLHYTANDLASLLTTNDDPGGIRPNADISGATFRSFLEHSRSWLDLSPSERAAFDISLPFNRTDGPQPTINGYLDPDRTYSAGGKSLSRSSVRSFE
ncbi:hypothetical protein [Dyella nitratireducens]|uniref:Bacterial HORMA domain-containing protein n=1 Tax=Dyella nitratireducens TaxID=1849580 RepID=A0ABQ1GC26_9GAMM|nr:hypothetical protein [Dyella nitratireducens]GGA40792.1 hypothetical protein GCM10010981_32510 [Dyella nitratireducens]GLQ40609.1 hypothetical protein GCM10007902_04580 [Dyella nitratireducens]